MRDQNGFGVIRDMVGFKMGAKSRQCWRRYAVANDDPTEIGSPNDCVTGASRRIPVQPIFSHRPQVRTILADGIQDTESRILLK